MAKLNTEKKTNSTKKNLWILFVIFVIIIPIGINILVGTNTPLDLPVVGGSKDWLMFWATYSSAVASFMMVWYTSKTLKQNDKQLEVIKKQWEAEHTPEIFATLIRSKDKGFIRIMNVSNISIKNLKIEITQDPEENIRTSMVNYDLFKANIRNSTFAIEPHGKIDIGFIQRLYPDEKYTGTITLKFSFNEGYENVVEIPFEQMQLVDSEIVHNDYRNHLEDISSSLKTLSQKMPRL